uniref:Uncharacterized protein n=1 Tax=Cucumis melo TaxID=3656 RepID=A0A9I9E5I3_CUCME
MHMDKEVPTALSGLMLVCSDLFLSDKPLRRQSSVVVSPPHSTASLCPAVVDEPHRSPIVEFVNARAVSRLSRPAASSASPSFVFRKPSSIKRAASE